MQKNSRVAVAERASARYMISLAFALTFAAFIASIGSNTTLIRSHLSLANEIPAAGDFDQDLAQKYFLLPTTEADSDATAPAPAADELEVGAATSDVTASSPIEQIIQVQKGDTLMSVLADAGIKLDEAHAAIVALSDVFSPKQLMPGQPIKLTLAPSDQNDDDGDGSVPPQLQLVSLSLQPSVAKNVELTRGLDGAFTAQSTDVPLHRQTTAIAGHIQSSLFEAGQSDGVPIEVMSEIIHAFSYDVDFQRDIQPGDAYEILYDRYEDADGNLAKTGNILYASLTLSGKKLALYRFTTADGRSDWFNPKGNSVRKALLRTPIDGAKITSGFGMRIHPILGYSLMHKGVDFGAPIGTPIYAAGDGVIQIIGPVSGYGNYIRLKHTAAYGTAYGHISRFAAGLRVGSRVHQGQVIAYVGMTGRATGPHLHFEVIKDGKQINPQSIKLPSGEKLQGKELKSFMALVANINRQLQEQTQSRAVATAH
ncbi:MAG TPA: peptidoglycan DD-metalloendopeptidase family protein [Dongiaceae bacterium]